MEDKIIIEKLKKIQGETSDLYFALLDESDRENSGFRSSKLNLVILGLKHANRSVSRAIKNLEMTESGLGR